MNSSIFFLIINGFMLLLILFLPFVFLKRNVLLNATFCPILAVSAIFALYIFLHLQRISGGPDIGQEFSQQTIPVIIYLILFSLGLILTFLNIKFYNQKR